MVILVTGSLGVIGRPLVAELERRGHEVHGCDLAQADEPAYSRCDVAEWRILRALLGRLRPDLVYHAAAEFGRVNGEENYEALWRTNVVGTKNVLRAQEELGFRLVFFSSSEVYGNRTDVLEEDTPLAYPTFPLNDYALTKWVNERQIENETRRRGGESVCVRLFNTYGPGEGYTPYRSAVAIFIRSALSGRPCTVYSRMKRTVTYIDDAVRTLATIAERFRPGEVYNVAGEHLWSMREISDAVLRLTGSLGLHVTYRDYEPGNSVVKIPSVEKAKRELGHENTVDLAEGLARTIEWMKGRR